MYFTYSSFFTNLDQRNEKSPGDDNLMRLLGDYIGTNVKKRYVLRRSMVG